ncbi:sugar transferase [Leucobacter sp. HY1910]
MQFWCLGTHGAIFIQLFSRSVIAATEPAWEKRYSRKLFWTDFAVLLVACAAPYALTLLVADLSAVAVRQSAIISIVLFVLWSFSLTGFDTRSPAVFGTGPDEYKRVINATVISFGLAAILLVATGPQEFRTETVFFTFLSGLFLVVLGRWVWRKRLHSQRRRSKNVYRTLIVGSPGHAAQMVQQLRANPLTGFHLVGAISKEDVGAEVAPGLTILATYDDLVETVNSHDIDTVIITSARSLTPRRVRRMSWELESSHVDLIVAASLTDVAGPRIHVRPVAGLPLIHVEQPEFTGWRYYAKRFFDLVVATVMLVPSLVVMLLLAVLVRIETPGPVLFRQVRLGIDGKPFTMYKLRSMRTSAENELPGLLDKSDGNGHLFKLKADPRVTRVGHFMRAHSLDELPQLFNVFRGDMSMVGPRPPLQREVDEYDEWVSRRLLVRPGISGLWQVSGRSNLSWEESVRLDLFYVENWSITGDLLILWRTLRAVVKSEGAY